MASHLLNISLGSFGMQLVSHAAQVKGEEMYVYPTGRKCREKVLNEVEDCDLARSRKWKVIQVAVLKGYLLLSSSLTFALVSNTYNLLWNILWILLSAALQRCGVCGWAGRRRMYEYIHPRLPTPQSLPSVVAGHQGPVHSLHGKETALFFQILIEKPPLWNKHNVCLMQHVFK